MSDSLLSASTSTDVPKMDEIEEVPCNGSSSSSTNSNNNPLELELILKLVLEHVGKADLTVTDLLNCRLVNHFWNRLAIQVLEHQQPTRWFMYLEYERLLRFKILLWKTELSRARNRTTDDGTEEESKKLASLRIGLIINFRESEDSRQARRLSQLAEGAQLLMLYPQLRVAAIATYSNLTGGGGSLEARNTALANQELFTLFKLAANDLTTISISFEGGWINFAPRHHFEEFDFKGSYLPLQFPRLNAINYTVEYVGGELGPRAEEEAHLDFTKHLLWVMKGARAHLNKLSLKLDVNEGDSYKSADTVRALLVEATNIEKLELTFDEPREPAEQQICKILSTNLNLPKLAHLKLRKFKISENAPKEFYHFLRHNCPLLTSLEMDFCFGSVTEVNQDEDDVELALLVEGHRFTDGFPLLPNLDHFGFCLEYYSSSRVHLEQIHGIFTRGLTRFPCLSSISLDLKILVMVGAHLRKSGLLELEPMAALCPTLPTISTLQVQVSPATNEMSKSLEEIRKIYHYTFPNVTKLILKLDRNYTSFCSGDKVQPLIDPILFLCSHPAQVVQCIEIHDYEFYEHVWLFEKLLECDGLKLQGLKSLKLLPPPPYGEHSLINVPELRAKLPSLEFLQYGKEVLLGGGGGRGQLAAAAAAAPGTNVPI